MYVSLYFRNEQTIYYQLLLMKKFTFKISFSIFKMNKSAKLCTVWKQEARD